MEGAAQTLVSNVGKLVGKEFRQLRGVGVEVARLRNELATINALLRMQSEADEGGVDHFVREWMKQLREVAYDAEDCVDLYLLRVRSRPGDRYFVWCKRLLTTLFARRQLASDIRALRALASAINEEHARYGVSLEPLRRTADSGPVQAVAASSARVLRPDNAQATELADKVKALENENDKQIKVFSIVGFGGLGKTTLAVEVCRRLETEFQHQAQVSVSQTFSAQDLQGLLKRVLRQIAQPTSKELAQNPQPGLPGEEQGQIPQPTSVDDLERELKEKLENKSVEDLERKLKEKLENKRYLVLIDDVWSIAAWDAIRFKLPSSNCGSRIIVTTRIDTVAKACSDANDDYIHHMKKLKDKESEQLFVSKALGSGNDCPDDLKDTMKSILKKCGGLPLAIVSIASLLASYKPPEGKEMWETVQKSIGSQMENNPTLEGMRQILTLSYSHLPHHLKACMMYLSIFSEDYMIVKDRLLKRWVAEGLIAKKRGLTQIEIAEGYFNELMSRNMIDRATEQGSLRDGIREEGFRVHDMMLEILVSKSLEANFVSLVGGHYEGMSYTDHTIRRLSIHGGVEAHKDSSSKNMAARRGTWNGIKGMMMQHVRSLSIFDPEAHKLLDRLGEFTLLRVLDLEDCKGLRRKHMNCICQMYLLMFLSLKGTDVKVMPRRVGDLEHLQTLDVRQTHLKRLPTTVKRLEKLEHLLFSGKGQSSGWMLPQGINKMKALRQVNKAAVIYKPKVAQEIGELDQLQELAIYVDTRKKMKQKVVENLACSLSKMNSLRWLDIGNFGAGQWPFEPIMEFLHNVESPPRLIRYLKIFGHMDRLPDWVKSLNYLVEFELWWTYLRGVQLFDVLCKLPNLKRLYLGPYFIQKGEDMVARSGQSFPELKELALGYSPEVPPVYRFEVGSMPKLEMLALYFGDQGKRIIGMDHLTNLKEVKCHGIRRLLEPALEQVKQLNNLRDVSQQITVKARYED